MLKDNHNPVWKERFTFEHLTLDELQHERVLEVTVWDAHKHTKHYDFIGGLRLGPRSEHPSSEQNYMDSSDTELSHWMTVVDTPGDRVMQLHSLRHSMSPQHISTRQVSREKVTMDVLSQQEVTIQPEVNLQQEVTRQPEVKLQQEVVTPQVTVQQEMAPPPHHSPSPHHSPRHTPSPSQTAISVTMDTSSPVRSEKTKFDREDSPLHATPVSVCVFLCAVVRLPWGILTTVARLLTRCMLTRNVAVSD